MIVAGGFYLELCEVPSWHSYYGSGGRAALAVATLSPGTELHTYLTPDSRRQLAELENAGVKIIGTDSNDQIAFSYFHPLSRPIITPKIGALNTHTPIVVSGTTVLRFGFIEGSALVRAKYAVYDPQTSNGPQPFHQNGSEAENLALVLNEDEVRAFSGIDDIIEAAHSVRSSERAKVIIVKGGTKGALAITDDKVVRQVPSYRSEAVFKIGTGDVFSSIFTHYWAELSLSPAEAADRASRSVASYCENHHLPLSPESGLGLIANLANIPAKVTLLGDASTLGSRWLLEEAKWSLKQLGANVDCPSLGLEDPSLLSMNNDVDVNPTVVLVMLDTFNHSAIREVELHRQLGVPIVIFSERKPKSNAHLDRSGTIVTSDFTTAMYFALWARRMN
jgi:hypothetical protein